MGNKQVTDPKNIPAHYIDHISEIWIHHEWLHKALKPLLEEYNYWHEDEPFNNKVPFKEVIRHRYRLNNIAYYMYYDCGNNSKALSLLDEERHYWDDKPEQQFIHYSNIDALLNMTKQYCQELELFDGTRVRRRSKKRNNNKKRHSKK